MTVRRGIGIALTEKSWRLTIEALRWVAEHPDAGELDEQKDKCGSIANYIEKRLKEKGGDTR
jgi:hypothetical protein